MFESRDGLKTLGGIDLYLNGARAQLPRSRIARIALAYLVINAGSDVSRDRLVDMFWPDADGESGRQRLKTIIWAIRNAIRGAGAAPEAYVFSGRHVVRWQRPLDVDVLKFLECASSGGTRDRAIAKELYGGQFFPGHDHPWITELRDLAASQYAKLLRDGAEHPLEGRDAEPAPHLPHVARPEAEAILLQALRARGKTVPPPVVVVGPGGIGKTSLVRKSLDLAGVLDEAVWLQHVPADVRPYGALGAAYERRVAPLAALSADATPVEEIAGGLLRSYEVPAVFILEDAHCARSEARQLVQSFARLASQGGSCVIVSTREEGEFFGASQGGAPVPIRCELGPLPDDALSGAFRTLFSDVDDDLLEVLRSRAGGNPFYTNEVIDSLYQIGALVRLGDRWTLDRRFRPDAVPTSLRDSLRLRTRSIGEHAELVAGALAVGGEATVADLARIAGIDEAGVAEAARMLQTQGIVRVRGGKITFAHDLIREVCEDLLPVAQRQALCRNAAVFTDLPPAARARYFDRAKDYREATVLYAQAGREAMLLRAWHAAIELFKACLACDRRLPSERQAPLNRGELHMWMAFSHRAAGDLKAAESEAVQAIALATKAGDDNVLGRAYNCQGWIAQHRGDFVAALSYATAMRRLDQKILRDTIDPAERLEAEAQAARGSHAEMCTLRRLGRIPEAIDVGERMLVELRSLLARHFIVEQLFYCNLTIWNFQRAFHYLAEFDDITDSLGAGKPEGLYARSGVAFLLEDFDESERLMTEGLALAERDQKLLGAYDLPGIRRYGAFRLGAIALRRCDFASTIGYGRLLLETPRMDELVEEAALAAVLLIEGLLGEDSESALAEAAELAHDLPDDRMRPSTTGFGASRSVTRARALLRFDRAAALASMQAAMAWAEGVAVSTPLECDRTFGQIRDLAADAGFAALAAHAGRLFERYRSARIAAAGRFWRASNAGRDDFSPLKERPSSAAARAAGAADERELPSADYCK
jgi:tetratricopeptide (TPR) repeat protein